KGTSPGLDREHERDRLHVALFIEVNGLFHSIVFHNEISRFQAVDDSALWIFYECGNEDDIGLTAESGFLRNRRAGEDCNKENTDGETYGAGWSVRFTQVVNWPCGLPQALHRVHWLIDAHASGNRLPRRFDFASKDDTRRQYSGPRARP